MTDLLFEPFGAAVMTTVSPTFTCNRVEPIMHTHFNQHNLCFNLVHIASCFSESRPLSQLHALHIFVYPYIVEPLPTPCLVKSVLSPLLVASLPLASRETCTFTKASSHLTPSELSDLELRTFPVELTAEARFG